MKGLWRGLFVVILLAVVFAGASVSTQTAEADPLSPELQQTLTRIAGGGPFPYRRDGIAFQNREQRLPRQPHGYYREYTVPTPGVAGRGARRVIAGGNPPEIFYYTDDHYRTFRQVKLP